MRGLEPFYYSLLELTNSLLCHADNFLLRRIDVCKLLLLANLGGDPGAKRTNEHDEKRTKILTMFSMMLSAMIISSYQN